MKRIGRIGHTMRVVLFALLVVVLSASSAAAWYFTASTLNMGQVGGSVDYLAKYFESGDGTSATQFAGSSLETDRGCAFEIANEDQFYNLAWLQYLGYFNETEENSTNVPTVYFYLSADLDMTGYTLPPIGTVDNPFLGNFNGNGHTVSNLTVANVTEKVSNTGNYLGNEELPLEVRVKQEAEVSGVEIIGLFGVVGSLPNDSGYTYSSATNQVKNVNVTGLTVETQTATALIGLAAGYVNGTLFNVGIANSTITVKDGTTPVDTANLTDNMSDYALVGYCTDAYKTMVKQDETVTKRYLLATVPQLVNQAMDAMQSGEDNAWGGSINMNDLHARLSSMIDSSSQVRYPSARTDTYLDGVLQSSSITTNNTASDYYSYENGTVGSLTVHSNSVSSRQYLYVNGERVLPITVTPIYRYTGVKIYNNGYYMIASTTGVGSTTDADEATVWIYDTDNNMLYTYFGAGNVYYLRSDGSSLSMSQTYQTVWEYDEADTGYLYYNSSSTGYALHCVGGEWMLTNTASGMVNDDSYFYIRVGNYGYLTGETNNANATLESSKANATKWSTNNNYIVRAGTTNAYLNRSGSNVYVSANATDANRFYLTNNGTSTYLYNANRYYVYYNNNGWFGGLTTSRNNQTAVTLEYDQIEQPYEKEVMFDEAIGQYTGNTYQDDSGTHTNPSYVPLTVQDYSSGDYTAAEGNTGYIVSGNVNTYGDVRVSYYARTNIQNSYNTTRGLYRVYTETTDGFHQITDESEFKNYSKVKEFMEGKLASASNVYGLHFMNAEIGNQTVRIPTAVINGDTYTNYPVPSDSIDFNLKDAGYISFMAGTYYRGTNNSTGGYVYNDSFFALYEIDRDEETQEINSIREIHQIYGDKTNPNQDYVYTYVGGGSSGDTAGLTMLFNTEWISDPDPEIESTYYQYAFYYEIPVNAGEYALGCVPGKMGAYLMYLDIGANGRITSKYAWIATTEDDVLVEDRVNRYGVPAGVDFAPVGTVGDADATVALTGSGSASFSRSGDTITGTSALSQTLTFLRDDAEADAAYVKNGATLTEAEVKPDTYSETDYLDAPTNAQPAFDTYGVDHQLITKTLTVRLHDLDAIEDVFTIRYSYEKDGILDDADDPVTINYTDPLIYMIQYDASRVTAAPALVSNPDAGFKGTIYIGATGDDSTLTQLYPTGTKTVVPGEKVYFQVYSHDELFRIYGDTASAANVSYDSVLNNTTDEQDFTYTVTGSALETPITGDGVTTASSGASAATLEYTLAAPADDESGNRTLNALNALNAGKNLLSVSPLTLGNVGKTGLAPISLAPQIPDETDPADDPDGVDAEPFDETLEEGGSTDGTYVEPFFGWTTPVQTVTNGSRSEYSDDEHVTRYYEYFPDDPAADEDGWILVLEIYDEGYEPEQTDETGGETPADGDTPEGGETPAEGEGTEGGETPADGEGTEGGEEPADGEGTGAGEPTDGGTDGNETDEEPGDGETPVSGGETGGDETIADGDETDPAQEPDEGSGEEAQGEGEGIEQLPETGDDEETPAAEPGGGIVNDGDDAPSGETPATGEVTEATDGDPGGPPQEPPEEPPEESPEGNGAEL